MVQERKRNEEQIMFQEPITVRLGGKDYKIKPLVIKFSRPWRRKLSEMLSELPKYAQASTDKPEEFGKALKLLMADSQDQIIDLFFEYAKDLDRPKIEETATEAEIATAFEAVMELAFPLAETLPGQAKKRNPLRQGRG